MIVKLYGGLGNQLFQWAFGKGISLARQTDLKFDASSFSQDKLRNFELGNMLRTIDLASDIEIKETRRESNVGTLLSRKLKSSVLPYYKRDVICEQAYLFDEKLFQKANSNAYFEGYWQNSKYFEHVRAQILAAIQFPASDNSNFLELKDHFNNNDITSIHIRRGDYLKNPDLLEIHGLCSTEYYEKAISTILNTHPNTSFYVFSDDIAWCRANLMVKVDLNYVEGTSTMFEDLELMTISKNNITANSSFSWWGAWLNQNSNKMIVSPKKWFNKTTIDFSEIVPESWIKL